MEYENGVEEIKKLEGELESKEAEVKDELREIKREEKHLEKEKKELELVTIHVNDKPVRIHRGLQTVAHIKTLAGVPQAFELEQVIHKKLVPLADNASVEIECEERFISHPRDNASS